MVECEMKKLQLNSSLNNKNNTSNFVKIEVDYAEKQIYVILMKVDIQSKIFGGYKFKAMVDFSGINDSLIECSNGKDFSDEEVKKIIDKYTFTSTKKITSVGYNIKEQNQLVRLFKNFRPTEEPNKHTVFVLPINKNVKGLVKNKMIMTIYNKDDNSIKIGYKEETTPYKVILKDIPTETDITDDVESLKYLYGYGTSNCVFGIKGDGIWSDYLTQTFKLDGKNQEYENSLIFKKLLKIKN